MQSIILETPNIILRELSPTDFDEVSLLLQDSKVMYAYEGPFSDYEVQTWIEKQLARYDKDGFGLWGIIEKRSGILIGQAGITYQEYNQDLIPEIGYLLRYDYWHKGYATEAANACKKYAFKNLNFDIVYSIIRDTNISSQNVAKRIGMTCLANFIKHYRGIDMPHFLFGIKRPLNIINEE